MNELETALAEAGYSKIDGDLIEALKNKQAAGTLSPAEAKLLAELEAQGLDLSLTGSQTLTAEELQALGEAQSIGSQLSSAPLASGSLGSLAGVGALAGGGGGGGGGGSAVAYLYPVVAAPTPTVSNAAISLFSDALTNDNVVTDFNPNWGQAGSLTDATDLADSLGNVKKFTDLNYQGVQLSSTDVSGQTSLHMDIWSATDGELAVFLIGGGNEKSHVLNVEAGQWNSFDIDLAAFSNTFDPSANVDLTDVQQLKFESQVNAVRSTTGLKTFYMDNLYFSTTTPTEGTPYPMEAAPTPTVDNSAISLFSDALTNDNVVTNFNPNWGQNGSLVAATGLPAEVGNALRLSGLNYQGIQLNATDVSAQESFHIDLWAADTGYLEIKLVATDNSEKAVNIEVQGNQWNSFDIDLDAFAGVDLQNIHQIVFSGGNHWTGSNFIAVGALTEAWIDNMYFSTTTPNVTPEAESLTFAADDTLSYSFTDFGGTSTTVVSGADAPTGSTGAVAKVTKSAGETWAGTTFLNLEGEGGELISPIDQTIDIRVLSSKDGAVVKLKLEDSTYAGNSLAVEVDVTTANDGVDAWETLTFDFGTLGGGLSNQPNWDKATIFFDFGNVGAGEEYYFDTVEFGGFIS